LKSLTGKLPARVRSDLTKQPERCWRESVSDIAARLLEGGA
jgi:hypothetical protein